MTKFILNCENIEKESFYNLCKIANLTGYANPIKAIQDLSLEIQCFKDSCGNIINDTIQTM